ncbi:hypothetical protein C8J55DRAFT_495291 [Lentinula edodes]|uniref:Uncharacterized protein n=1 Tax=Lentinula lateritia TaxID=40482 RepID=A0A9W9B4L7_9AGAR|nr:hypothetical protein C8J55DRAFT_495291 [Lentinula edodes]
MSRQGLDKDRKRVHQITWICRKGIVQCDLVACPIRRSIADDYPVLEVVCSTEPLDSKAQEREGEERRISPLSERSSEKYLFNPPCSGYLVALKFDLWFSMALLYPICKYCGY